MGSLPVESEYLQYPSARRDESVVDNYHGVVLSDPYRWMENPEAEEVKDFVQKQQDLTESVLKSCCMRGKLVEKITKLIDHHRYSVPFRHADKYFYFHNTGLQAQDVIYIKHGLEGKAEVLLDPNGLSEDGTVSLKSLAVSPDAKYLAYGESSSGSDWQTIKVMEIESRRIGTDSLSRVKFLDIAWTHDNGGFFYCRFPTIDGDNGLYDGRETTSNLNQELCYHFLGTDQSEDILCWKDLSNPTHRYGAYVTEDGKYLLLLVEKNCGPINQVYCCDMSTLAEGLEGFKHTEKFLPFTALIDKFEAKYEPVANDGSVFTFLTNKNAPNYKLARVDLNDPRSWIDVIPEAEKDVLESAYAVNGNQLIINYLSDVKSVVQLRDLETGSLLHHLPIDIGSVYRISTRRQDSVVFFGFGSFLTPGIIYQCDLKDEHLDMKIFHESCVPDFDRSVFKVNQVFVPNQKDGTNIPMFIVSRKDIRLDGSHPCLLYGYGGFNVCITPHFKVSRAVLMKHLDVVFCIANIRGGGEYGDGWHKAGSLSLKQNCFDDFIASAEYLISTGYTQPSKLCMEGASNGGLLVGACINQRPDLFGCALAHVGVMDMLRFHKFTIGHAWTSDFGCSDNEKEFKWLIKYSPLHNVKRPWEQHPKRSSQYPATMLLTADHDDRVVPLHSLKLLATMQFILCTSLMNSPQSNPIIGRIERNAGHGCGRPTHKQISEAADRYSFMAKMLDAIWID